jgi:hypothetical protein
MYLEEKLPIIKLIKDIITFASTKYSIILNAPLFLDFIALSMPFDAFNSKFNYAVSFGQIYLVFEVLKVI